MDDLSFNEFRPPDDEMISFVLDVCDSLKRIAQDGRLSQSDAETVKNSARTMLVLMSMAIGGHWLFEEEASYSTDFSKAMLRAGSDGMLSGQSVFTELETRRLLEFLKYRDNADAKEYPNFPSTEN